MEHCCVTQTICTISGNAIKQTRTRLISGLVGSKKNSTSLSVTIFQMHPTIVSSKHEVVEREKLDRAVSFWKKQDLDTTFSDRDLAWVETSANVLSLCLLTVESDTATKAENHQ